MALQRGVIPEVGDDFFEGVRVQDRALHVLGAGVFTAFDLQHLEARFGQGVRTGIARCARTDDDGIKLRWFFHDEPEWVVADIKRQL